jgi:hypothetical protein
VIAITLMVPAAAAAQSSSSCGSYNSPALCSITASKNKTDATTAASTLPFTGLDAILLAVGGASLLGAGALVRVLSRRLD